MKHATMPESKDLGAVARSITYRPETRMYEFRSLALSERSAVFNALSARMRQDILRELTFAEAVELLDHLDPQRVHHVLSQMNDARRRARLIARLRSDRYEKSERFLAFHPQASLALFHLNYVYLADTTSIGETVGIIEEYSRHTGKMPVVLAARDGKLVGEISLSTLARERNSSKLRTFVRPVRQIAYHAPREEALALFLSTPHDKVVVTDHDGSVLGVIYSDDVADLLEAEPAMTLYSFASVEASERPFDGVWDKVKGRYRWLLINLATCFAAAGVVKAFDGTINELVILAVFMPIVGGMGSNAATQTLAVMVRGIAVGEINLQNCRPAIWREVAAGALNGLIISAVMVPAAWLFGVSFGVSLIAAIAVITTLVVAGWFGSLTPLVLKHWGKDPATSAGIIISTATDVSGYLFLLGLASLLLLAA